MDAQTITAWTGLILAVVALIGALVKVSAQLSAMHVQINSRMDQLVAATAAASHAKGVADERDAASVRVETPPKPVSQ